MEIPSTLKHSFNYKNYIKTQVQNLPDSSQHGVSSSALRQCRGAFIHSFIHAKDDFILDICAFRCDTSRGT